MLKIVLGLMLCWGAGLAYATSADATSKSSDTILILRASGKNFAETSLAIQDDLGDEFKFIEKVIKTDGEINHVEDYINSIKPRLIVLIGNLPIRIYTVYQNQNPKAEYPPSVALSALYVDRLIVAIKNIVGIRHEIPAVTSLVKMRELTGRPMEKVGVLYRSWMRDYIKLNAEFCQLEGIELVGVEIPNTLSIQKIKYHLKHLLNKDIDALWVINDNAMLSSRLMQNVWVPSVKQFSKPVIVGVEGLTATALNFGTFSVVPDQYALGIQGAGLIGNILDDKIWQLDQKKIYEPLSVKKLLNLRLMKKHNIDVQESMLETLDGLIE